MADKRVTYREWELHVDTILTGNTYAAISQSSAEACNCLSCRNFIAQREAIYPEEVRKLFLELGIDYRKEIEVSELGGNGLRYYSGWFQYKGSFFGADCSVPLSSGGSTLELNPVEEHFDIGFRYGSALTPFVDIKDIVTIEFACRLPWVLKEDH